MKKWISVLLILVMLMLCLTSCDARNKKKYNSALDLIAEGKYEEAYEILLNLGDCQDAQTLVKRFYYIPLEIKSNYVTAEDTSIYLYQIQLNENNLPEKIIHYGSSGYQEILEYTYDENGNLIREIDTTIYDLDTTPSYTTSVDYTYDQNGNLIQTIKTNNAYKSICKHYYDAAGNIIQEIYTFSGGGQSIYTYTYDTNGNLIKEIGTDSDGDTQTYNYIYDIDGNLIKVVYVTSYGYKTISDYTYDANGNLTKKTHTYKDGSKWIEEYTYDENGNMIQYHGLSTSSRGDTITGNYSYDTHGNLVKKIVTYLNCGATIDDGTDTTEFRYQLVYIPSGIPEEVYKEIESLLAPF